MIRAQENITIRTELKPGDLGYIIYRHGKLYHEEYGFGIDFESYVAAGIHEFYQSYNPSLDRVWICEDLDKTIGFLLLMHRDDQTAQLRYFYLEPEYRGMGLGKKLMQLYMDFLIQKGYRSSYLLTVNELHSAAALYKKHGFKLIHEKESGIYGRPMKEQRYELRLR